MFNLLSFYSTALEKGLSERQITSTGSALIIVPAAETSPPFRIQGFDEHGGFLWKVDLETSPLQR
jgi:hypothetical protein